MSGDIKHGGLISSAVKWDMLADNKNQAQAYGVLALSGEEPDIHPIPPYEVVRDYADDDLVIGKGGHALIMGGESEFITESSEWPAFDNEMMQRYDYLEAYRDLYILVPAGVEEKFSVSNEVKGVADRTFAYTGVMPRIIAAGASHIVTPDIDTGECVTSLGFGRQFYSGYNPYENPDDVASEKSEYVGQNKGRSGYGTVVDCSNVDGQWVGSIPARDYEQMYQIIVTSEQSISVLSGNQLFTSYSDLMPKAWEAEAVFLENEEDITLRCSIPPKHTLTVTVKNSGGAMPKYDVGHSDGWLNLIAGPGADTLDGVYGSSSFGVTHTYNNTSEEWEDHLIGLLTKDYNVKNGRASMAVAPTDPTTTSSLAMLWGFFGMGRPVYNNHVVKPVTDTSLALSATVTVDGVPDKYQPADPVTVTYDVGVPPAGGTAQPSAGASTLTVVPTAVTQNIAVSAASPPPEYGAGATSGYPTGLVTSYHNGDLGFGANPAVPNANWAFPVLFTLSTTNQVVKKGWGVPGQPADVNVVGYSITGYSFGLIGFRRVNGLFVDEYVDVTADFTFLVGAAPHAMVVTDVPYGASYPGSPHTYTVAYPSLVAYTPPDVVNVYDTLGYTVRTTVTTYVNGDPAQGIASQTIDYVAYKIWYKATGAYTPAVFLGNYYVSGSYYNGTAFDVTYAPYDVVFVERGGPIRWQTYGGNGGWATAPGETEAAVLQPYQIDTYGDTSTTGSSGGPTTPAASESIPVNVPTGVMTMNATGWDSIHGIREATYTIDRSTAVYEQTEAQGAMKPRKYLTAPIEVTVDGVGVRVI